MNFLFRTFDWRYVGKMVKVLSPPKSLLVDLVNFISFDVYQGVMYADYFSLIFSYINKTFFCTFIHARIIIERVQKVKIPNKIKILGTNHKY